MTPFDLDTPHVLVDVAYDHELRYAGPRRILRGTILVLGGLVAISLVAGLAVRTLDDHRETTRWVLIVGVAAVATAACCYVFFKRAVSPERFLEIRRQISAGSSPRELIASLWRGTVPFGCYRALSAVAQALVAENRLGTTLRLAPEERLADIQPFTQPFRARRLVEAESGAAQRGDNVAQTQPMPRMSFLRRTRRSLQTLGGWWAVVGPVAIGMIAVHELSKGTDASAGMLAMATVYLLVFVWGAVRLCLGADAWLVVPGGLVMQKSHRRRDEAELRLFDRRQSVLIVYEASNKNWGLVVADEHGLQHDAVTRQEAQFLLRAWLSPLPPPPLHEPSAFGRPTPQVGG